MELYPFHFQCMEGYKKLKHKNKVIKWPTILECELNSNDMERLIGVEMRSVRTEARQRGMI
jgi:hypothetical protein